LAGLFNFFSVSPTNPPIMFFQGTAKIADHFDGGEDERNCQD